MDKIERFFEDYAKLWDQGLIERLSEFSAKSFIIVTDEAEHICHSKPEVEAVNKNILNGLKAGGVEKHMPKIIQSMRLSESVLFVKVRWTLLDENEKSVFSCYCSYTLQIDGNNLFKILVVVLDDEHKQFRKLIQ